MKLRGAIAGLILLTSCFNPSKTYEAKLNQDNNPDKIILSGLNNGSYYRISGSLGNDNSTFGQKYSLMRIPYGIENLETVRNGKGVDDIVLTVKGVISKERVTLYNRGDGVFSDPQED